LGSIIPAANEKIKATTRQIYEEEKVNYLLLKSFQSPPVGLVPVLQIFKFKNQKLSEWSTYDPKKGRKSGSIFFHF